MKKFISCIFSVALAAIMLFSFAGCNNDNNENESDDTGKEYVIQYTDDTGTHQITVTAGMPYSLETLPKKEGYVFTGLFDAEVGGTQYISANGSSLALFTDKQNIVLFPQFKAKEYTLFLDYQGADVTGTREYKVSYGERLPELPKNVNLEHSEFNGWYTKTNCGGVQVADKYGLLPGTSYVNDNNFDLSGEVIYLYAGFEAEKHIVTFCYEAGMDTEEVQVPYNTPINEVVPDTRVNGNAVLTWSKTPGGEVFNGKVTGEMVLYAKEYAPVIELDSNGGSKVTPIVARAGSTIALPTPTKDLWKFSHWEDMSGNKYTSTTMPSASISLKAVWQAKLVFDSNGGSAVDDISVAVGNNINLPTPEKEGFIFAGWYTEDNQKVGLTAMPGESICLKAGWYEISSNSFYLINENKYGLLIAPSMAEIADDYRDSLNWHYSYYRKLNLSEILNGQTLLLEIKFSATLAARFTGSNADINIDLFSAPSTGSTYLLNTFSTHISSQDKKQISWDVKVQTDSDLYVCYYKSGSQTFINNLHCEVIYPDLSNLYL